MKKPICIFLFLFPFIIQSQNTILRDSLNNIYKSASHDSIAIIALMEIGDSYLSESNDSAVQFFEKAIKLSQESNSLKTLAKSIERLGVICFYKGDYPQAIKYYQESVEISKKNNDLNALSRTYTNLGAVYGNQGLNDKCIEYFHLATEIDIESGNKVFLASDYNNLGILCKKIDQNEKALEYLNKALELQEEIGSEDIIPAILNSMATIHIKLNQFKRAIPLLLQGLELGFKVDKKVVSYIYNNLGICYESLGEYPEARLYYEKAEELNNINYNKYEVAMNKAYLARLNIKEKKYDEGLILADQSLAIAKEINSLKVMQKLYESKSIAYFEIGNYKDAYLNEVLFKEVTDSILNETMAKQISEIQSKFEIKLKDKENDQLKMENEIQTLKADKAIGLRNLFVSLSLLTLAMVFFISYRYNLKNKANKALSEKNEMISKQKEELSHTLDKVNDLNLQLNKQNTLIEEHMNNLEIIVANRTSELQEKVNQLEHYHDLFISREFRIKELRDEVKSLKQTD